MAQLAEELQIYADWIGWTPKIDDRISALASIQENLDELEPMLTDPRLRQTHQAVVDLSRTLLKTLPALEEQAEYLRDLKDGQEKFAFLTGMGVKAIADAVRLAAAAATPGSATPGGRGMGDAARSLMITRGITEAEMAAIKLYTAPEYKYMTVGMEKSANEIRPTEIDPAGDPAAAAWLKSAIGGLENTAEIGAKTNVPRSAKQNINPKTGQPWTPEQLKKKGRHRNDAVLGAALGPGQLGPLSPADTAMAEGQRHTKIAVEGLKKLPEVSGIETYRGMSLPASVFEKDYKKGGRWHSKALTSTSQLDDKAVAFLSRASGEVKFLIKFQVTRGRDVDAISVFSGEKEVLLLPGATGIITDIEPETPTIKFKVVHIQQTS